MPIETIISLLAALGVGGILGALLNRRFEQQKQTNEHDINIFKQSDEILNEQNLSDTANFHLLSNHSIGDDHFYKLTGWCTYFEQAGNQYLDRRIASENQKLLIDLNQLTDFIGFNFFTIKEQNPNNKNQYLKPDWNPDYADDPSPEKMSKYDEYAKELEGLTLRVTKQYSKYRFAVKRSLKI
ncbi:MAG TPA: hypothetical protein PKK96_11240 [Anaerolineales bacterium]|nr:hypothetical protein [Anaerolineales bacterium]HNQ96273.1 hypothetical protein [Anaerolineales bacterium]HNS61569.1 hypothetical protein [Anaerolineales bacterium]